MPTPPKDKKPTPSIPRPSSSVLLISPHNQVLLLQRVQQSSSFPSAHVFPGGNVSTFHDGAIPPPESPHRHVDSETYRLAAIRETFEESGILLARNNGFGRLIEVSEEEREQGRRLVHGNQVPFRTWLAGKGGRADVDGLIPFTRWITPTNVPKRFTTQMYLYFLPTLSPTPMSQTANTSTSSTPDQASENDAVREEEDEIRIPVPTTDGGKEHTTARFLPASVWLRLAQQGRIILFPPQFYLLHKIAQFLDHLSSPNAYDSLSRDPVSREQLESRRKRLRKFVTETGAPLWTEKCISPTAMAARGGKKRGDGRSILGLRHAGVEVQGMGRAGVEDECVLVELRREGPRKLAVVSREEALREDDAKL